MGNHVEGRPTTPLVNEFLGQFNDACVGENLDLQGISAQFWVGLPEEAKGRIEKLWLEASFNLFKNLVSIHKESLPDKQTTRHDEFLVCSIIGRVVQMNLNKR